MNYKRVQEAARKDIERVIGILTGRFNYLYVACMLRKKVNVLDISACCVIIHNILIRKGDYGVLDWAKVDADSAKTVMKASLGFNVSLGIEEQSEHVKIGRIARNSHQFFTDDEPYMFHQAYLTSLAEHMAFIYEIFELHNGISVNLWSLLHHVSVRRCHFLGAPISQLLLHAFAILVFLIWSI